MRFTETERNDGPFEVEVEETELQSLFLHTGYDDSILYLGGRIDDNNLYPSGYIKYLNQKIKKLNPKHIICHSHWYAWKYYDMGVLDKSMKIDTIMCDYENLRHHTFDPINKEDYQGSHRWCIKPLVEKNPNIVFALYDSFDFNRSGSVGVNMEWFGGCNDIKYFTFDRRYTEPEALALRQFNWCHCYRRNGTDGFSIVMNLLKLGFKNLNIIGFTAFGSDEDDSNFSKYITSDNPKINNRNYFNIETSECQRAEADILKYWVENKKIYNLENYEILKKENKC